MRLYKEFLLSLLMGQLCYILTLTQKTLASKRMQYFRYIKCEVLALSRIKEIGVCTANQT